MNKNNQLDKAKFKEILNDAEVNFQNQRYADAAKTFEFLSDLCMEQEKPEDMIYYQYRALLSHKILHNTESQVRNYQRLAINALKASTVYAMTEINSPHIENSIALLWYVQQNLKMLDDTEKRKSVLVRLHQIFQDILEDEDLQRQERLRYLERSIELSGDLGMTDQLIKVTRMKANLIEEEANEVLNSNGFDIELVASHKFLEAAQIYADISEFDRMKKLIDRAKNLYPDVNLKKYNFDKYKTAVKRSN